MMMIAFLRSHYYLPSLCFFKNNKNKTKAEEVGNRGSQQIADAYKKEGVVVAGMMQLDMTAYVRPGTEPIIAVIEDFVSVPLSKFVAQLAAVYCNIPSKPSKCGYGCRYVPPPSSSSSLILTHPLLLLTNIYPHCSDHASWTKAGYPSSHPFEALEGNENPSIHTPNDVLDKLQMEHAIEFANVALGFMVELSLA